MKLFKNVLVFCFFLLGFQEFSSAQNNGEVRGFIYDKETLDPMIFTTIYVKEIESGVISDINGFYSITKLPAGKYTLIVRSLGFDSLVSTVSISAGQRLTHNLYLTKGSLELKGVVISGEKQKRQNQIQISTITISPKQLKQLPTVGGEPDIVQYLQVLPGVVSSGDQGGQLYIRGGAPIHNKVILDGMTIYNPFHSIGLFSVFDADIIRSAEVHSAGFNTQYGGRVSAIVDVNTREGNKKEFAGKLAVNPFTSKLLIEAPFKKAQEGEGASSFILSYKTSYLEKTSKIFYAYADSNGLPYNFDDFYGKISITGASGSKVNFFGFNFKDRVNYNTITSYGWNSTGLGSNFLIIPSGSSTIINGIFAYSNYEIEQSEIGQKPRESKINGFNAGLNFTYFIRKDEIKYGIEINGFRTEFNFFNSVNRKIEQNENTTELALYSKFKKVIKKVLIEPGIRIQYYSSLGDISLEPRFGTKWNVTSDFRIKAAGGYYSQNLMSAVSDRDVVNLFYGFLSGPDDLQKSFAGDPVTHRLQKARHAVFGIEIDLGPNAEINSEAFIKDFTQLTNINREKIFDNDDKNQHRPELQRLDFIIERGKAYGGDISYKYEYKKLYIWAVYSLTFVERFDGVSTYAPHFDRRHNINLVTSRKFGKKENLTANVRWNLGSGFPFTQTQGYYEQLNFNNGVGTDFTTINGTLGIQYAPINTGRLPYYHRLDASVEQVFKFRKKQELSLIASVTNIYNRDNVFYFDRVRFQRVNQLPIMPSVGINFSF